MTVGDVKSNARGSGARYNDGKPALELIPLRLIGMQFLAENIDFGDNRAPAAANALIHLGGFQERNAADGMTDAAHLRFAIASLNGDFNAWYECARVFDYGRKKYAAWNWSKGMQWSVVLGCVGRHLLAIINGEENDPESGLSHRGHAMCNIVMLLTFLEVYPEGDDRMPASIFNPPAPSVETLVVAPRSAVGSGFDDHFA